MGLKLVKMSGKRVNKVSGKQMEGSENDWKWLKTKTNFKDQKSALFTFIQLLEQNHLVHYRHMSI